MGVEIEGSVDLFPAVPAPVCKGVVSLFFFFFIIIIIEHKPDKQL